MKPIATPDPIIAQAVKLFAEPGYAETIYRQSPKLPMKRLAQFIVTLRVGGYP